MAKNDDVLSRFASAGNETIDLINRVDTATSKFQPGQRKGSIVKSAQGNVFEFPVFISNSIPLDYATATTSLLEQIYAAYLQMAISLNPVIDASSVKNGLQFADFKTNTNKYLEYTDTSYQHDACHAVYQEDGTQFEFNMISIEDRDARLINEAVDHQPLSEFDHFFQEAPINIDMTNTRLYPIPQSRTTVTVDPSDPNSMRYCELSDPEHIEFATVPEIREILKTDRGYSDDEIDDLINCLQDTCDFYELPDDMTIYQASNNVSSSDSAAINNVRIVCGTITPGEYRSNPKYQNLRQLVDELNTRNPGFRDAMFATMADVQRAREHAATVEAREAAIARDQGAHFRASAAAQRAAAAAHRAAAANSTANANKTNTDIGNIPDGRGGTSTYSQDVLNQRRYHAAQAAKAEFDNSRLNQALHYIDTSAKTASDVFGAVNAGANAVTNIATLPDQIKQAKYKTQIDKDRVDNLDTDRALKRTEVNAKAMAKAPQYVDDSKCQKLNTMKPLLMNVTVNMLNKDDSLQPINYIVGVKTHMRVIPASILPEVARYPLKEMDKLSRKVKWRAGELKFLKDLVFRINEKKQTAADSRDPNRKWYRRLYELAHMKGDAPASAVVQGKSIFAAFIRDKQGKGKLKHGMIPNASIIMSQQDVDNIKNQTEIDLLKASNARKFCGELFLISLIIVDIDAESIKILLPDQNNDFDVHSLAAVQKQLATLDTSGTKTRDMFKLLG